LREIAVPLVNGTWLTTVTDPDTGDLLSRSIPTLSRDNNFSAIDSNEGGVPGQFAPFCKQQDAYECKSEHKVMAPPSPTAKRQTDPDYRSSCQVKKSLESGYPPLEGVAFRPIHGFATAISGQKIFQVKPMISDHAQRAWFSSLE
jgi:hypothetical protein